MNIFNLKAGLGQYMNGSVMKNSMPVARLMRKPTITNGRNASAARIGTLRM